MYCRKCGKQVVDGTKFCTFCGAPLDVTPETAQMAAQTGQQTSQGAPQPGSRPKSGIVPRQAAEVAPGAGLFFGGGRQQGHPQAGRPQTGRQGQTNPQPHYLKDDDDEDTDEPKRRSKLGPILLLVVLVAIMAVGGVAGWKWLKNQQVRQSEVDVFQTKVDAFSEYLDDPTYSSKESQIRDLLSDCERAVKAKDTDQFPALEKRMERLVSDLSDVSVEVGSLEELESTYSDIINNRYAISYDMQAKVDTALNKLSEAVKNGDVNRKDALQAEMEELVEELEADNRKTVQDALDAVAALDLTGLNATRQSSLHSLDAEIQSLLNKKDFKAAVAAAERYKSDATQYARELAVARSESISAQQRRESEAARIAAEEAARKESEEEARRESEEEARRESEEAARRESEEEARRKAEEEGKSGAEDENGSEGQSAQQPEQTPQPQEQTPQEPEPQPQAPANRLAADYVCPGSNSRYLTEGDLAGLSAWELMVARNEIYARHGRKFNDPNLQAHFNSKSWYSGTVDPENFDAGVFNDYELKNIEFIIAHES